GQGYLTTTGMDGSTTDDMNALDQTAAIPSQFVTLGSTDALPTWYSTIYATGSPVYRHTVAVENVEEHAEDQAYTTLDSAMDAVRGMYRVSCPSSYGSFTGLAYIPMGQLARIKSSWTRQDRLSTRSEPGNWFSPDSAGRIHWNPQDSEHAFEQAYLGSC